MASVKKDMSRGPQSKRKYEGNISQCNGEWRKKGKREAKHLFFLKKKILRKRIYMGKGNKTLKKRPRWDFFRRREVPPPISQRTSFFNNPKTTTTTTTTTSPTPTTPTMTIKPVAWETIKHKFIGGPYVGAGGMAIGGGSVGVEAFVDDKEAIKAIRLFPGVMRSFGGLGENATDDEIKGIFLPAMKVMLPDGGNFHDVLYNIRVKDNNTITCTTGDMQLTAPRFGSPVFTSMLVRPGMVEMDLHGVEKWAWLTRREMKKKE